ncbi:FUSC family protein [Bdellovibrio bacteriovorus]|uniref:FUSC family protein n=1 Tax=Bdellovibrio bacteriovorus TaxID=959 RepID=UPI0021CF3820|nr:FUSC family protein [Bdellovibrio bacteriovorus]UXR66040.1 FUSC family protein [Bdellovibrio bacteriovorus]
MSLRHHIDELLKINPVPSPWPRMFVCALSTTIPLIIGLLTHQMGAAIFGSLMGFLLVLNDHMGTLGHRLWTITLTCMMMLGGLTLGMLTHGERWLLMPLLFAMVYCLGLMGGGKGAELERALLFSVFQILAGAYIQGLDRHMVPVLSYALLGYLCVVLCLTSLVFLRRHKPNPFARLRASFKQALTTEKSHHLYATGYASAIVLSLLIVDYFKIDHGYWAVGTVLIIMRPELKQSIYRSIQRFLGTLLGVLIADIIIYSVHSPWVAIVLLGLISFWGPWSIVRSYWLGSAVLVVMLLIILDMPNLQRGDLHTPMVRLTATGIGCLLSLVAIVLVNPQELWRRRPH